MVFLNYNFNLNYDAIGVQSIYKGGGETNKSEIVWADVEKAEPVGYAGDFTFDFNKMDVPTSSSVNKDGDITEDKTITEGSVSLTISTSTTTTPNRFWGTTAGPQLRVYGGTLTFEVPEGAVISQIVFNHNGKWGENTADSGKITNDTEANAATWTGEAQTVVVTIAANSQNHIHFIALRTIGRRKLAGVFTNGIGFMQTAYTGISLEISGCNI